MHRGEKRRRNEPTPPPPKKEITITQIPGRKVQAFLMLAAPAIYRCVETRKSRDWLA